MADSSNIKEKEDKLANAKIEKDKGNEYFKAGDINNALRHYYISLLNLNGLENDKSFAIFRKEQEEEPKKDPLHEDITKTTSVIYSNMAACHIKKEKWSKAIERADEVMISHINLCRHLAKNNINAKALKKDPENTKALFRRAQALIKDGNTTKAREDLTKLTAKDPDDGAIKREWQLLKAKEKEQERKQRKELAGMFDRMKREDEKEERSKKQQQQKVEQEQKISEIKDDEPKISEIKDDEPKITEIKDDEPKITEIKDDEPKISEIKDE
ncbi:1804_t:CDS:2 [Diversispora eburnea]|uniref:1804_t:CDS:1 n=1 Tax=Diversispora eburnea TaxID=1213867 RepID=A0A9N8VME9_9GLOM|nr:1804_t:CDS:2 [Diversispora eburnea]